MRVIIAGGCATGAATARQRAARGAEVDPRPSDPRRLPGAAAGAA
ncbi:hypothetical protein [Lichenibacterium dinghuense]|nr:hypothetical protein [Lichenibacterium sp. 6Y81]